MGCWKVARIALPLIIVPAGMPVVTADAAPVERAAGESLQESSSQESLVKLVGDFVHAQLAFDVPGLTELTTPDYLEISPIGEVDSREKMLSFYAPDKKSSSPAIDIQEPMVRVFGDTAIIVVKLAYTIEAAGQPPRVMALRASFVARRTADRWKLASAQYTGIRPAK